MQSCPRSERNTISENRVVFGKRPLFFTAVFFLAGLLTGSLFDTYACIPFIAAGAFVLLHIILSCRMRATYGVHESTKNSIRTRKQRLLRLLCGFSLLAAALFTGMGAMLSYMAGIDSETLPEGSVTVAGRVREVNIREYGAVYKLTGVTADGRDLKNAVFVSYEEGFGLDDIVQFEGELARPAGKSYEFGFDDRLYSASNGVSLRMRAEDGELIGRENDLIAIIDNVRADIGRHMDELFLGASPVAKAMLLGMDDSVDSETMDKYRASGISHVLCVSGLHVSVICYSIYLLLKKLRVRRGIAYAVCMTVLVLYVALAGFRLSVLRSAVMFAIMLTGTLTGERGDALTGLAAAFLLLAACRPAVIFDVGFQLSFAAVFSIICIAGSFGLKNKVIKKLKLKNVLSAFIASFAAFLGTFLILLNMNGEINLLALLLSPFSVLLAGVLLPVIAVSTLIYCIFGGVTVYIGYVGIYMIALQNTLAGISEMAGLSWAAPAVYGASVLAGFAAIFAASKYTVLRARTKLIVCSALALMIPLSWAGSLAVFRPPLRIDVLAGEYDDCAVITTKGGRCVLIDAGEGCAEYLCDYGLKPEAVFITAARSRSTDGLAEAGAAAVFAPYAAEKDARLAGRGVSAIAVDSVFKLDADTGISAHISGDGKYANYEVIYKNRTVFTYMGLVFSEQPYNAADAIFISSPTKKTEELIYNSRARYAIIKNGTDGYSAELMDPAVCGRVRIDAGEETRAYGCNDGRTVH